jgi:hypothetical protein
MPIAGRCVVSVTLMVADGFLFSPPIDGKFGAKGRCSRALQTQSRLDGRDSVTRLGWYGWIRWIRWVGQIERPVVFETLNKDAKKTQLEEESNRLKALQLFYAQRMKEIQLIRDRDSNALKSIEAAHNPVKLSELHRMLIANGTVGMHPHVDVKASPLNDTITPMDNLAIL